MENYQLTSSGTAFTWRTFCALVGWSGLRGAGKRGGKLVKETGLAWRQNHYRIGNLWRFERREENNINNELSVFVQPWAVRAWDKYLGSITDANSSERMMWIDGRIPLLQETWADLLRHVQTMAWCKTIASARQLFALLSNFAANRLEKTVSTPITDIFTNVVLNL